MTDESEWGVIFDIKRFALHDGDGIRSTIFTKGCPLSCPWCHNPEGRVLDINLMWFETLCIGCGACVGSCPSGALSISSKRVNIDKERCVKCGKCVEVCPSLALKFDGKRIHYRDAFRELAKDKVFFIGSGGGVTLSGGDPLVQSEFNLKLLALCKEDGIKTTVETCLFASKDIVRKFAEVVDSFFVDIKIFDDSEHKRLIGVSNRIILENFELLSQLSDSICVRIPLIPGMTDSNENIAAIAGYVRSVNPEARLELLNYNPLAKNKYDSLQEKYLLPADIEPLTDEEMAEKNRIVDDIMER